ncbi:hypothetical protein CKO50_17215 [Pseudoalteromonas sp. HM-SA03]|uniref:hypothetical protein n=1 Tax=Pseudoalteromonas sp. HM-SA03 TaxID=2029678 RepID=UPI000BAE65D4|nr:hypothetical protein [Pseudoalteromonas sp. HM-SA03]PAY00164.1 hypothetical protein CKO50_17215 [Pseudoalteromonas sp. HM-SA03]
MSDLSVTDLIDLKVHQQNQLAEQQSVLVQLGQIQAFNFIGKMVTVSELKLVQQIKDSKEYKGLSFSKDGKTETVSTWEQFCDAYLDCSAKITNERLTNLSTFGEQFFEQAQKMKLGYRHLQSLRQLPDDQQTLVIESEAVEVGNKEAVQELIDELKAKHSKEKDKLAQELDATERMLKVSRDSSSKKEEEIIKLKTDLESKKFSAERWKGEAKSFFEALAKTQNQVREGFNQMLVLSEQLETVKIDDKTYDAAKSAFYADSKILLTQLAHVWNEIHRTYGDLDDARPSGEWLAEMGFEGTEVMK